MSSDTPYLSGDPNVPIGSSVDFAVMIGGAAQDEEEAYAKIPSGMGEQLSACPLKQADYLHLAKGLDSIIETLKK